MARERDVSETRAPSRHDPNLRRESQLLARGKTHELARLGVLAGSRHHLVELAARRGVRLQTAPGLTMYRFRQAGAVVLDC